MTRCALCASKSQTTARATHTNLPDLENHMYLITLTRIESGEQIQRYTNPLPMSDAAMADLERYGIAVTQVLECDEHIILETFAA